MSGNLIDTNVIIKFLSGNETALKILENADEIFISVITVGELFYGVFKSNRFEQNREIISGFLSGQKLLDVDDNVSKAYGEIKSKLVKAGINIPENDLWIAATAVIHSLKLVTFDGHFSNIEGLEVISC